MTLVAECAMRNLFLGIDPSIDKILCNFAGAGELIARINGTRSSDRWRIEPGMTKPLGTNV